MASGGAVGATASPAKEKDFAISRHKPEAPRRERHLHKLTRANRPARNNTVRLFVLSLSSAERCTRPTSGFICEERAQWPGEAGHRPGETACEEPAPCGTRLPHCRPVSQGTRPGFQAESDFSCVQNRRPETQTCPVRGSSSHASLAKRSFHPAPAPSTSVHLASDPEETEGTGGSGNQAPRAQDPSRRCPDTCGRGAWRPVQTTSRTARPGWAWAESQPFPEGLTLGDDRNGWWCVAVRRGTGDCLPEGTRVCLKKGSRGHQDRPAAGLPWPRTRCVLSQVTAPQFKPQGQIQITF